ncbi:MAG: hypothetical protein AAF518_03975 [Spirochaetota bacterium]
MKIRAILFLCFLLGIATIAYNLNSLEEYFADLASNANTDATPKIVKPNKPIPEEPPVSKVFFANYEKLLIRIKSDRVRYYKRYKKANSKGKKRIIQEAKQYITKTMIQEILPAWYGTDWAFGSNPKDLTEGYSNTPRKGSIACGMFVTTTLQHMGFNLNRKRHGKEIFIYIMKNIITDYKGRVDSKRIYRRGLPPGDVRNYHRKNLPGKNPQYDEELFRFNAMVEKKFGSMPDGLYIIGLANHGGFLAKQGKKLLWINSSYDTYYGKVVGIPPFAGKRNSLVNSVDIYACDFLSNTVVTKWIQGTKFRKKFYF